MAKINDQYDIGTAFEAIENELIASMIRNFENHKQEETDEKKHWSMWQAEMLKSLEKYKHDNQKKYGKQFKDINKKIEALISLARSEGGMNQEKRILEEIKNGFPAKKITKGGTAEFFKVNDRKLDALIQATTADMQKAEAAVLRMANDQYRKIIYNAQVYANTGAGTYEKAVDMATKDFLSAGLNCVEYANGARHTLSDYADMAIRTASKRAYLQGEGEMRQQWGLHLVIMNKRGSPCPKCLPFVGKILIDNVWSGGSSKDGKYPLMSSAVAAGLYHPRCKDSHTTYFPGITKVDPKYNKQLLILKIQRNRKLNSNMLNVRKRNLEDLQISHWIQRTRNSMRRCKIGGNMCGCELVVWTVESIRTSKIWKGCKGLKTSRMNGRKKQHLILITLKKYINTKSKILYLPWMEKMFCWIIQIRNDELLSC